MTPAAGCRTRRRVPRPAALAGVILVLLGACAEGAGTDPAAGAPATDPSAASGSGRGAGCDGAPVRERRPLEGFGEVTFRAAAPGGPRVVGCALLADTAEARGRGLMDQQDLRGYDAMVFRFDAPTTTGFYMFDTVLPLSVAYLDAEGGLVSSADMAPCTEEEASACPTYDAAGPYLHAVEVPRGGLVDIGIEPGVTVTFDDRPAP